MAPPVVLLINTQAAKVSRDGDEEDSSLLYAYTNAPRASGARVFSALVLAVKGALASICGEQARAIQVQSHGHVITLALVHLKACMLVVVLPMTIDDQAAQQLTTTLAASVLFLAGPSEQWIQGHAGGSPGRQQLLPHVKAALEMCCQGVLAQGLIPSVAQSLPAPWLSFPDILPCLQLPATHHRLVTRLLAAHQEAACQLPDVSSHLTGVLTPTQSDRQSNTGQPPAGKTTGLRLYSRTCSLMYKGLVLGSGMPPAHQTMTWQVCCSLGAFAASCEDTSEAKPPGFQVWVQPAYVTAASSERVLGADSHSVGGALPPSTYGLLHQHVLGGPSVGVLVVAASQGLTAAVLLQPYEWRVDMLKAGQLEGVAAVGWLQEVQQQLGGVLESALSASPMLNSMQLGYDDYQCSPRPATDQGTTPGRLSRHITPFTLPQAQNLGLSPTSTSGSPGPMQASFSATPRSGHQAGMLSHPGAQAQQEHDKGAQRKLQWEAGSRSPGAGGLRGRGALGTSSPLGRSGSHKPPHQTIPTVPEPHEMVQAESPQVGLSMGADELGSAVVVIDLAHGHMHVLLDQLPRSTCQPVLSAAWPVIARCHNRLKTHLGSSSQLGPVTAQLNHHSLILTLSQVERLAGLRAPPESGLRLGAADSAPWQHHPELAILSGMHQVAEQVVVPGHANSRWWVSGYLDIAAACQVLVLHSDKVREGGVVQQAKMQLELLRQATVHA